MSEKPEALRLAEWIESDMSCDGDTAVAAELRRLHAEAADFHMAYRLKCDEETKVQAVEIARLRAECEALRADAERYRWLCEQWIDKMGVAFDLGSKAVIDEAVDNSRKAMEVPV